MHSKIGQIICSSQYSVIKLFIYIQQLVLFRTNHIIIWKLLNTMLSPLVLWYRFGSWVSFTAVALIWEQELAFTGTSALSSYLKMIDSQSLYKTDFSL